MVFTGRIFKRKEEPYRAVVIDDYGVVSISDEYRRLALENE